MRAGGERRQVTVLFCDLIDSTRLLRELDPEDTREIVHEFVGCGRRAIEEFGGHLSQVYGDGILAVFGYPRAHEDDAMRATQAGLAIAARVPSLTRSVELGVGALGVRIGIATGVVIAGDRTAAGPDGHEPMTGQTVVLAQRLQSIAPVNGVVISANTHAIAGARFSCAEVDASNLKGVGPELAWQVHSVRSVRARYFGARNLPPIVDREEYLEWLLGLWSAIANGEGRAACIVGEAGIGKSRLLQALQERIVADSHQIVYCQCEPLYANTALHPVIEHIRRNACIGSSDPHSVKFEKLLAWCRLMPEVDDAVPLLAALLSIPTDEHHSLPASSAQRQKERTFEVIHEYMRASSADTPLLVIVEDLHWADPSTQEYLTLLMARLREVHALVVCTSRPEPLPQWAFAPEVARRELHGLARGDAVELAERWSAGKLSASSIEQVIEKSEHVPLYIEELTKAVASGADSEAPIDISAPLHQLLRARIDQAEKGGAVAQVASAFGREFSYRLLAPVFEGPAEGLIEGLHDLERAGLVYVERPATESVQGDETYVFKHALLQKVAYDSMLRSRRPGVHRRIAEAMERIFPDTIRDTPELLAHHWTEAGNAEKAVATWLVAGKRSSERSDYREAIGHLRRGLRLIDSLPDPWLRCEQELAILVALAPVLITTEGAGTKEVGELYSRALELCKQTRPSAMHFVAHWGWWRTSMDHRMGRDRADKLLDLAGELGEPDLRLQAHHCQWATLYMVGELQECCRHIEAGLALYDHERDHRHASLYGGHDARVCGLGESALAFWMLGRSREALARADSALEWSTELSHVGSRVHALDYSLVLQRFGQDAAAVQSQAEALYAFASEQRLRVFRAKGQFFRGWARAMQGAVAEGLSEMLDGIASERAADTPHDFTLYYEMLAEVYALAGRAEDGLRAIHDAFEVAQRNGIVFWNAELHRRHGELLLVSGNRLAAQAAFEEGLTWARRQGSRPLELRAAIGLCRVHQNTGERAAFLSLVQTLHDGLRGEGDTPDLEAARMVLERLQ